MAYEPYWVPLFQFKDADECTALGQYCNHNGIQAVTLEELQTVDGPWKWDDDEWADIVQRGELSRDGDFDHWAGFRHQQRDRGIVAVPLRGYRKINLEDE